MSPIILMAGGLVLGVIAGFLAGRLAGTRRGPGDPGGDGVRLRRQARELSAELRKAREELAHEAETTNQIPFIVKKLGEKMPREAIPGIAVRIVKDIFQSPTAGFLRLRDEDGSFLLEEGIGFPPEWKGCRAFSASAGILGEALARRIDLAKEDYLGGRAEWPTPSSSLEEGGIFPDLVAPVAHGDDVYGVLVAAGSGGSAARKKPYLLLLADMVGIALHNAVAVSEKDRQECTDPLTGLYNRRYFNPRFGEDLGSARENTTPLSFLLFDIDGFRDVNDAHGRAAGDAVLKRLAEIVQRSVRSTDVVARYGGEEFAVLMNAANKEQAFAYAERLRETIARTPFDVPGLSAPLRVAVSAGVAAYPEDGASPADLVKAAGDALHAAKKRGRNRVVRAARAGLDGSPA